METSTRVIENWLTQKTKPWAYGFSMAMGFLLFTVAMSVFGHILDAQIWLPASGQKVFVDHQYWRLWTSLFTHGDFGHVFNNAILFIPLVYLLYGHFGYVLFPVFGFLMAGLTNYIVLGTLPPDVQLVGISGLVYWMGAVYTTLYLLIDTRKSFRYRLAQVIFITVMLFVPDTYQPQVSYLSHGVGYALGVLSALVFYKINQKKFLAAEVREVIYDEDLEGDELQEFLDETPESQMNPV